MDSTATGACSYVPGVGVGGGGSKLNALHGENRHGAYRDPENLSMQP